jgi:ketosteroid isomerase-like protein
VSRENVEVIERVYAAWNRDDMDAVLEDVDPAMEWWDRDDDPDATVHRGLDGVRDQISGIRDAWVEFQITPRELIDTGDFVVAPYQALAKGRTSGMELVVDEVHVFRVRAGKIVELREYREKAEALKAVDLEN